MASPAQSENTSEAKDQPLEEDSTESFDTNTVVIASLRHGSSEPGRAMKKKKTPKPPASRFDVKQFEDYGPLAASLIVIIVLGSVAMMEKFSRRKSTRPRSSILRPLGTGIISRPPVRSETDSFFEVAPPVSGSSFGAPTPRMLDQESRDRLEEALRETLIDNGRLKLREPSGVEILSEHFTSTVTNILRFAND